MGFEFWADGSTYIGQYELGKKEGFGKYQWADSSFFIGEWKDNKIHGYVRKINKPRVSTYGQTEGSSPENGNLPK